MRVIGTAGHVDHGKSTLVQALTGINPDRWEEEQVRQLTIDLGFAWLTLPNGEDIGVVDVPGHEDFIENMLAGVGGIDVALLVIAADEGVMPQTREHLAILDLLTIPRLVVALTKVDAVEDEEWLELVEVDVAETLAATRFEDAPIVRVSGLTGEGLDTLLEVLSGLLNELTPHAPEGIPRLPVDRVFTISGFGTIVTGTLLDGSLAVGETLEIQPTGQQARIRGLQSHEETVEVAMPGSRTAVNLSGIEKQDVRRGYVLTRAGYIHPTRLMDVELIHLPDAARPLKHNTEVKVFVGTAESMARVRLLDDDMLHPGQTGWAQLQLAESLPVLRGQRFIVRIPSPAATIGGGVILDTAPGRKWKRNRSEVIARFERLSRGTPVDVVSAVLLQARKPMRVAEVLARTLLPSLEVIDDDQTELLLYQDWLMHVEVLEYFEERVQEILQAFHQAQPLQPGMHANTLRREWRLDGVEFGVLIEVLIQRGVIAGRHQLHLPDFEVQFTPTQQQAIERLMNAFDRQPYTPPSVKEVIAEVGEPLLDAMVAQGTLVRISADVVLGVDIYREWVNYSRHQLESGKELKVSSFRDTFNTSRKYALAFLEHLETYHLTRRVGDEHLPGSGDWSQLRQ